MIWSQESILTEESNMRKTNFITLFLSLFLLISCHPDQYFLSFHFPSASIKSNSRAYLVLMPGLRVYTVKNFKERLIGMVGEVRYEKDSVVVDIMLDRQVPVGSGIKLCLCKQPNIVCVDSNAKKFYRPGEVVIGDIILELVCQ
jgi:hypothetical protein